MKTTILIAGCLFTLGSATGCRQESPDSGLDSDPPAAGAVREANQPPDTLGTPATDPMTPTVEGQPAPGTAAPAPSPGTTPAPAPGTTTAPSPGTAPSTNPPPTGPGSGVMGGGAASDAGARVPPPATP